MRRHLLKLLRMEDAATAVEYAVMLSLIAGTIAASVTALSTATAQSFEDSASQVSSALGS